jgi:hypothetical protein
VVVDDDDLVDEAVPDDAPDDRADRLALVAGRQAHRRRRPGRVLGGGEGVDVEVTVVDPRQRLPGHVAHRAIGPSAGVGVVVTPPGDHRDMAMQPTPDQRAAALASRQHGASPTTRRSPPG